MKALVVLLLAIFIPGILNAKVQIYTIESPPTVVKTGDGIKGLGGDFGKIVSAMIVKSGRESDFEIIWVPWKRGLIELERNKKALFFPFTRTIDREERYSWVYHLADLDCWLYALNPAIKIAELSELKRYRVGVLAGSAREAALLKYVGKSNNVDGMIEDLANYRKLESGRIDIWATQPVVAAEAKKRFAPKKGPGIELRPLKKLIDQSLWLAANQNMSKEDRDLVHDVFRESE